MPIFNGDLEFFDGSGVISVTNGDLTIRTDDPSRSIIIASGAALRSDRDIASDLGTANLRWHAAHVGNLFCTSGEIAGLTMTDTANTFGVDVVFNGVNVQFINSATTTFDDSSDISIEGNVFIGGTTSFDTRSDLKPWIDASTSLGNADVRWSTIHAASGIFNTIAPPESGTHIQVNGDLRPSEDVSYSLGTSDVRWDNVFSRSGVIGFNTFDINGVNFQDQVEFGGDVDFQGISVSLTSASFSSDANSPLSFGGNTSIFGQLTLRTDIDVLLDASYQIGNTFNRWATIHAASGTFNVITPPVSGTYIQVNGGLSPALDATYPLGGAFSLDAGGEARWSDIFAASGHFNAIYPQVSGIGVGGHPGEWIELGGSLIPPANGGAGVYWLGMSKFNLLGGVAANSGIFTDVTATTMDISSLDVSTLNINNNGDFINVGAFDWDLGGAQTLVGNGDWVFDTDATLSATTGTFTTATIPTLNATTGTITTATIPTLGSTTITAATINSTSAMNCFGTFGTLGLASLNGGTFFGNAGAPSTDANVSFGLQGFRWRDIYMVSGQIESLTPRTSGSNLLMHGSFVPGLDSAYDLGTTDHRWDVVHAVSGSFDNGVRTDQGLAHYYLSAPTGSITGATTIPLDQTIVEDTSHYSMTTGVVTINQDGLYKVTYSMNIAEIAGSNRCIASGHLLHNSTPLVSSMGTCYVRDNVSAEGTVTKSFLAELNDTDTIEVQGARYKQLSAAVRIQFQPGSTLSVEYLRGL